jgi:hypothetical protein
MKTIFVAGLFLCLIVSEPSGSQAATDQRSNFLVANAQSGETQSSPPSRVERADFLGEVASDDARQMADWVVDSGDNRGLPFVIVDKKNAKVFVLDHDGQLLGATPALLGLARGDDSAPGIGNRKLSDIRPEERTTPAGRFVAALGLNLGNQEVLWVDYRSALALHSVLTRDSQERRLQRIATTSPLDKRITFGCINVPSKFYNKVVRPAFTGTNGIVYILPEIKSIAEVFFAPNRLGVTANREMATSSRVLAAEVGTSDAGH